MKKTIASLLVLCLCIGLCACGRKAAVYTEPTDAEQIEQPTWMVTKEADEFGDITENSPLLLRAFFTGTLNNATESNSEVIVKIWLVYNDDNSKCYVCFKLFDLGENAFSYTSSDIVVLKTKVDGKVTEYIFPDESIQEQVLVLTNTYDLNNHDGNFFINNLYNGKDVKCVLYVNNSQYNFTVESANFKELYDEPYVGKVSLPGTFVGKWVYSGGDATLFSIMASKGEQVFETKEIDIQFSQDASDPGNQDFLTVSDIQNSLENEWDVGHTLYYIANNTTLITTTGFASERKVVLREDKTLVITLTYYRGEPTDDYNELKRNFKNSSSKTTISCEFTRVPD